MVDAADESGYGAGGGADVRTYVVAAAEGRGSVRRRVSTISRVRVRVMWEVVVDSESGVGELEGGGGGAGVDVLTVVVE